jgi:CRP-like cAMP-binding protein
MPSTYIESVCPVRQCPICTGKESETIEAILNIIVQKEFKKNAQIIHQGDEPQGIYLLASGSVKVLRLSSCGKEILLDIMSSGYMFGEQSLFAQKKYPDSVIALENCRIYFLQKDKILPVISKFPEITQSVLSSLCKWMDKLNSIIENINTPSARERVCAYLLRLQSEQKLQLIQLSAKKHDIALMLGLRPETFSRVLGDLENEQLIKMNSKQIQLLTTNLV